MRKPRYQLIDFPLALGIDTRTDPKLVDAKSLLDLQNHVFDELGNIQKRFGYTRLGKTYFSDSLSGISVGSSVSAYKDELVVVGAANQATGGQLHTYSEGTDSLVQRGDHCGWDVRETIIRRIAPQVS